MPALRISGAGVCSTGCGHRKSVCPSPQRRSALQPDLMPSSQACVGREEVPVALAKSRPTGPLPPVIHPQPPSRHRHPAPGGCRSDFKGNSQNLEARRRPRGRLVGPDPISSRLIRGSSLCCQAPCTPVPCPAGNKSGRGWAEGDPTSTSLVPLPRRVFSPDFVYIRPEFSVQIRCSGTTWWQRALSADGMPEF